MSSMHRVLDGDVLVHHLTEDERTLDADLLARHGRTARTIVKEGPLRLTLMGLAAGGVLPPHRHGRAGDDPSARRRRDLSSPGT